MPSRRFGFLAASIGGASNQLATRFAQPLRAARHLRERAALQRHVCHVAAKSRDGVARPGISRRKEKTVLLIRTRNQPPRK